MFAFLAFSGFWIYNEARCDSGICKEALVSSRSAQGRAPHLGLFRFNGVFWLLSNSSHCYKGSNFHTVTYLQKQTDKALWFWTILHLFLDLTKNLIIVTHQGMLHNTLMAFYRPFRLWQMGCWVGAIWVYEFSVQTNSHCIFHPKEKLTAHVSWRR